MANPFPDLLTQAEVADIALQYCRTIRTWTGAFAVSCVGFALFEAASSSWSGRAADYRRCIDTSWMFLIGAAYFNLKAHWQWRRATRGIAR